MFPLYIKTKRNVICYFILFKILWLYFGNTLSGSIPEKIGSLKLSRCYSSGHLKLDPSVYSTQSAPLWLPSMHLHWMKKLKTIKKSICHYFIL